MEWNQNTYDMWMLFAASMQSQAIWFASCAFLIWVGFRFTNNIYNDSSTPVIAKVLATGFCGSVALLPRATAKSWAPIDLPWPGRLKASEPIDLSFTIN